MSELLNRLKKYKDGMQDDDGTYYVHGEPEDLIFESEIKIRKYEEILSNLIAMKKYDGNQWYEDAKKLLNK